MSEQEVMFACSQCSHTTTDRDDLLEINETLYCFDCGRMCEKCDTVIGDDGNYLEDRQETWCDDCCGNYSFWCEGCDSRYSNDTSEYIISDLDVWRCEHCSNNHYNWCEDHEHHYDAYCLDCDEAVSVIHDYSYKPTPEFYGSDSHGLFFGIEVETEIWSRDIDGASQASQGEESFYLKKDGSIGNGSPYGGFEIVSHPHSLDRWLDPENPTLKYLEDIRRNFEARSWDAISSCGLHIHISRDGFGSGAHTHRFLTLIYSNAIEMSKLGGRKGSNYAKFSDVYKFDDYGRPYRDFRDKIHASRSTERYSAVNTINRDTIELRWFQGTLKRDGIIANIQLAHAMVEYTRYITVAQVREGALRWDKFAQWVTGSGLYPQLEAKIERLDSVSLSNKPTLNA